MREGEGRAAADGNAGERAAGLAVVERIGTVGDRRLAGIAADLGHIRPGRSELEWVLCYSVHYTGFYATVHSIMVLAGAWFCEGVSVRGELGRDTRTEVLTMRASVATSVWRPIFPSLVYLCAIELVLPQPDVNIVVPLA